MVVETTMHNYGMTIRGTVEGTALSFREECKRVAPTVSRFYAFESDDVRREILMVLFTYIHKERSGGACEDDDASDECG